MSELVNETEENIEEEIFEPDFIVKLKASIDANQEAAILCEAKKHNPNFLSIIHANKKFCQSFNISQSAVFGKSYDFLFTDFDLEYSSEDQFEYVRLIKSVKDFQPCVVIANLQDNVIVPKKSRFKINFIPSDISGDKIHHAILTFERVDKSLLTAETKSDSDSFLRGMERALRNERLLREVSSLIILDLPIHEVAQNIAEVLCRYLKIERCLLHDYREGRTNFISEYCDSSSKPMFKNANDGKSLKIVADYINFQNHFYEKFGKKEKKSSLLVAEDVMSDRNFLPIQKIYEEFSIASQIAVTTAFNGKVNGGIYIHQSTRRTWLPDEVYLVETIADQFSIAVDRSDSIERVMIANHALMEKTSQLKEALKHEQEVRKMQTEFVALVSHEFKTPLQIIDSARELMSRKIKNNKIIDESLDKSLERIKNGIQRMNGLIHSVLNLAKIESGENTISLELGVFDLKKFVSEIIEKNSNLALNKNIKIISRIDDLPHEFHGDQKLLDHSIGNVISNAIKYSKSNSTVKILAKANEEKVALRVIDQGIGIPKEDLESIGKKFFRAKNSLAVAGTGIGIYLTKHFIELHGGDVLIESEINVGTSVTITIPRNL